MNAVTLQPGDLVVAGTLLMLDGALSLALGLGLHRAMLIVTARMAVQLLLIGTVLRAVFRSESAAATLGILVVMTLVAIREGAARPRHRLARRGNYAVAGLAVGASTALAALLALTTALRPDPWWNPRYAIPVTGIVLGSAFGTASLTLDSVLSGAASARAGIEAQLALGHSFAAATGPLLADAIRRGLMPVLNQMAAAGLVTLPGTMTGQILAGADPIEAVKYQILLMLLLAGASALAAIITARLAAQRLTDGRQRLRLDRLAPA